MKLTLMLLAAGLPAFCQIQATKAPAKAAPPAAAPAGGTISQVGTRPARTTLGTLEKTLDDRIVTADLNDPIDLLGATRGLYLDGYGAVFTAEMSLIQTPNTSAFQQVIKDDQKARIHQRKLAHLPVLRKAMTEMMQTAAGALNTMPAGDKLVFSVRLLYYPWEDTTGLPVQIVMKADRQSALAGKIQTEEQ